MMFDKDQEEFIKKNYQTMLSTDIAQIFNVSRSSITAKAMSMGLKVFDYSPFIVENLNCERSYILELLWADGQFSTDRDVRIETVADDMNYFYSVLKSNGNWRIQFRNRPNRQPQANAYASSRELSKYLKSLGFVAYRNSFTQIWDLLDRDLRKFFVLGLFDGDGCFYFNKLRTFPVQVSFSGRINQDWDPLHSLITNDLNVYCNVHRSNRKAKCSTLRISSIEGSLKFMTWLYDGHNIGLPRKKNKFKECFDRGIMNKFKI